MSDPNDNSIPILQEVLVPGHAAQRRCAGHFAGRDFRPIGHDSCCSGLTRRRSGVDFGRSGLRYRCSSG
ncbi:hypothetical protein LMG22037_04041 [Paraburkholderia phenoliruptrix]|uniref:Uncharacterized protein n=1 Tax=Paraburkholderia phenoliruptrix TaxID=252970 RepID=A0A6J5BL77_9BURK|nr:hypothetical protein LMG22037_04041 [Paraburkholderia phenoliruptrix]